MRNAQTRRAEAETFEKRIRAYVAGAGAVAAGLLACSPPAAAQIVFVSTHVSLDSNPFPIDIDGTTEFTLATHMSNCHLVYFNSLTVAAASGAGVVGHGRGHQVAALRFGAPIGTADLFESGGQRLALAYFGRFSRFTSGPFANVTDRFLGLKFELNGQVYYGWAGFSKVTADAERCSVTATLEAYAYETEPNTPIYAGQTSDPPAESRLVPNGTAKETATARPATLGVLALGSLGLDVWRKREDPATDAAEAQSGTVNFQVLP